MADEFEWDTQKAAANLAKHKTSFEMAREALKDPLAIEWLEGREHGEERFNALGVVDNRVLFIVYAVRHGTTRIISARPAAPNERRRYHEGER